MSKIEEALEKAAKLRETPNVDKSVSVGVPKVSPVVSRNVENIEVRNQHIITITEPNSPISEEYRRLKSMLLRETKHNFLNTIMITSSVAGEGKTLTAINLAVTLAQEIDHSILLVDADLRRPMIHEYLGIHYKYGLSDYLTQDIDVSDVLVRTGIGNLVLLPAGRIVENPVELLSSKKMMSLVKELKQRYMDRYVIIDTVPILSCAESIALGSCVDGIIFVVKRGGAQHKAVEDALGLVKGLKLLGVVFNNVNEVNLDGYHTGNYYNYRYKKGGKE